MNLFVDLFATVDATLTTFRTASVARLATYVTDFVRVAGIISVVLAAIELYWAGAGGIKKIVGTFLMIALVGQLATVPAHYNAYIGNFLATLPDDLLREMAPTGYTNTAGIGGYLDTTITAMGDGISRIWGSAGFPALGGSGIIAPVMLSVVLLVLLLLMGAAAMISIIVGKVSLAMVVGLGPLFIMTLVIPGMKDWFTKWLSYAFSMAILQLLIGAVMSIASTILDTYATALTSPTATIMNNPSAAIAPALVMLVLAYIFGQLPSMASSLGGGIGITTGNLAWSGVKGVASKVGWELGGRAMSERQDAARQERVAALRKEMSERGGDAGGSQSGGGSVHKGQERPHQSRPNHAKRDGGEST